MREINHVPISSYVIAFALALFVVLLTPDVATGFVTLNATSCNVTIGENANLSENMSCAAGNGVNIGASNIVLDCSGFSVIGADVAGSYGINNSAGYDNVTVRNCTVTNFDVGIYFTNNADSGNITNNTVASNAVAGIYVSGSGTDVTSNALDNNYYGIALLSGSGKIISFNTIENSGSGTDEGIYLSSDSNNVILSNNVTANTYGIHLISASDSDNITDNIAYSTTYGIYLDSISNAVLTNNSASSNSDTGILLSSSSGNTFVNNTADSNTNYGIYIIASSDNILTNNTFSYGASAAIGIESASIGNNFTGTNIRANDTWLLVDATSSDNRINDTTFDAPSGRLRVLPLVTIPISAVMTASAINATSNRAYVNSTNLTFLNTSSEITFTGITYTDPKPTVDLTDSGTFIDCPSNRCTELSYSGGVYTFNVTGWSAYSVAEGYVAPTPPPSQPSGGYGMVSVVACYDKIDNDGDGLIDMADPGCSSINDRDEVDCRTDAECAPGKCKNQTCIPCKESWSCTEWNECSDSVQIRECTDANACNTTVNKPATSQSCEMPEEVPPALSVCGDGICAGDESASTCSADCGPQLNLTENLTVSAPTEAPQPTDTAMIAAIAIAALLSAICLRKTALGAGKRRHPHRKGKRKKR